MAIAFVADDLINAAVPNRILSKPDIQLTAGEVSNVRDFIGDQSNSQHNQGSRYASVNNDIGFGCDFNERRAGAGIGF